MRLRRNTDMNTVAVLDMYCTVPTASTTLGISKRHVLSLASSGSLRSYGQGALLRIEIESVNAFRSLNPEGINPLPEGYVYLIYWHGYYKIGMAIDPVQRMRDIWGLHPVKPEIIHLIPTDFMGRLERRIHTVFAEKRVSGEWFDLNDEDVQRIKSVESYLMNYATRRYPSYPI